MPTVRNDFPHEVAGFRFYEVRHFSLIINTTKESFFPLSAKKNCIFSRIEEKRLQRS